jgi:two-component system, sensor histidine kinase and response regulator
LQLLDGSIRHIRTEGTVIYDNADKPVKMVGINTDITQEIDWQERLLKKRECLNMAQKMGGFGIWEWNITTNELYANDKNHSIFGVDPLVDGEINSYAVWRPLVHPDDIDRVEHEIQLAFEGVKDFDAQFRTVLKDGSIRHIKGLATVIRDDEESPIRMFGINYDITEEFHRMEQIRLSAMVIAETNDVVIISDAAPFDESGPRVIFVNDAFERVTGYSREEIIGKNPRILQGPETDRATLDRIRQTLERWQPVQAEVLNYKKTGEPFWNEIHITPVANETGWFTHWVSIQRDITERKLAEQNLEAALKEAETSRQHAQQANEAKSRFLATMSHEIRTPLNGILGMAEVMDLGGSTEDEQKECIQTILEAGRSLTQILNDILDFSTIESGKLKLVPTSFDPNKFTQETTRLFQSLAEGKGLQLECDVHLLEGQRYRGDPLRLRQMLSNLVSNAIKFTERGSIRVSTRELSREGNTAVLEFAVEDTGIGIPSEDQARIFDLFTQVDESSTRQFGGTGLGLAIVHELAAIMGGSAHVTSTPGGGSRISFSVASELTESSV